MKQTGIEIDDNQLWALFNKNADSPDNSQAVPIRGWSMETRNYPNFGSPLVANSEGTLMPASFDPMFNSLIDRETLISYMSDPQFMVRVSGTRAIGISCALFREAMDVRDAT